VRRRPSLFDPRNHLTPDRIVRIFLARNQIEKMRSDCEREFVAAQQNPASFFIAKIDILLELTQRSHPVLELPFPIVPKFAWHALPIAGCMGNELFSIAISKRLHFE